MAKIRFYFDEMMHRKAADQLIQREYMVVMANDVGMTEKDDLTEHLPCAAKRGLLLVTLDRKFAGLASLTADHAGLVCITGIRQGDIGAIVRVLAAFAQQRTAEDVVGRVFW